MVQHGIRLSPSFCQLTHRVDPYVRQATKATKSLIDEPSCSFRSSERAPTCLRGVDERTATDGETSMAADHVRQALQRTACTYVRNERSCRSRSESVRPRGVYSRSVTFIVGSIQFTGPTLSTTYRTYAMVSSVTDAEVLLSLLHCALTEYVRAPARAHRRRHAGELRVYMLPWNAKL